MGVTRFAIAGIGVTGLEMGPVQRWKYDSDAGTIAFESSFGTATQQGVGLVTIGFGTYINSLIKDPNDGSLYIRPAGEYSDINNIIYRATASTLALITGWGSGGFVSCKCANSSGNVMTAVNSLSQLFASTWASATLSTNLIAFTSTGAGRWIASLSGAAGCPNGGAVGAVNSVCIFYPYSNLTAYIVNAATGSIDAALTAVSSPKKILTKSSSSVYYTCDGDSLNAYPIAGGTAIIAFTTGYDIGPAFIHTNGSLYFYSTADGASLLTSRLYRIHPTTFAVQAQVVVTTAAAGSLYCNYAAGIGQTSAGEILVFGQSTGTRPYIAVLSVNLAFRYTTLVTTFISAKHLVALDPYIAAITAPAPAEKSYSRRLVAIAQNRLYYEDASAQITVLSGSISALDTGQHLTACEAFQKVFVANNSVLAVADFTGTKLTTQSVGGSVPRGTIITGSDSGARLVVDLATDASGTCEVYGSKLDSYTFISTDTCTNAALSVSFILSNSEFPGPSWYNWRTHYGSESYGIMPTYATLVAAYRGRLVLSGNKEYPYQWYMSRVADPWDFEYTAGDPLTAIAGSNADAGKLGDIIRALIPYSPDFMIFGCANSMWLLNGDPAAGGSLDEITKDTGIYGPKSWCKDDKGDLYFFGTYGLYHMAGGRGQPSNILSAVWPNLIDDWGLNPNSHRIVMGYDVQRAGIVVCMTNLTDGTNKAFFYHVPTGAVFPETYHTECAPYSMCAYPSDDATTKGLILGCQDAYLRHFEDGATEDVGSVTTAAVISAYVGWVEKLTEDEDTNMKLNWLFVETGGAISGDTQTDTTSVNMSLYAADDAETCMQKMAVGTVAFLSTSFSGNGRQNKFRQRIKTPYLGVQFATSSVAAYWTINKVVGDVEPSGGIR